MLDLVFRNVLLPEGTQSRLVDIGLRDGKIALIGDVPQKASLQDVDGRGLLVLPPFIESHIHLDTVLTAGEPAWNESGTLFEGIGLWQRRKLSLTVEDVLRRAERVLRLQVSHGILHIRTQADISDPKLVALRALLELRERVKPYVNLQVIAFPQDGIRACPDNEHRLVEALKLGADGIGAIPHMEPTREEGIASLEVCFRIAKEHGCFVHVFCDEIDDEHSNFIETVAHLAMTSGLRERVTASHANASAYYGEAYFQKLLGLLSRSGINVVCCPLINSAMQGRLDSYPKGRGIARIKEMWQAGVNVSIAHDDIQSPFYPLGTGSVLQAANMAAHLAHMTGLEEVAELVRMVTVRAAKTLQIEGDYGVEVNKPASFVLVDATDYVDLIRRQPVCRYVVSNGRIVAETLPAVTSFFTSIGNE
ncbi:amidohydrolase family protein [Paenibacillus radicis (ex Xue et al. 2023)]|uniref:Amidohydrolase family protein n=1 Tax=Paenibacillus radicis (ex Xue et al. 2023) TaxID=2972489 RepID=A0ABT1YLQ6_9BACL|nr:amidohydrolase family protein [Paenibacillus radicis (ex Xue et al. 2023)]MCR8633329.1 amidohydrolase family protein [Paenibacillus radicis (ex Xue et al. 2023)]